MDTEMMEQNINTFIAQGEIEREGGQVQSTEFHSIGGLGAAMQTATFSGRTFYFKTTTTRL